MVDHQIVDAVLLVMDFIVFCLQTAWDRVYEKKRMERQKAAEGGGMMELNMME